MPAARFCFADASLVGLDWPVDAERPAADRDDPLVSRIGEESSQQMPSDQSGCSERHGYDFNGHVLRPPEGNLCIDPVEPGEAFLDQLAVIGATRVLLTNRNHTRAANLFRARLGARTAIHPKDTDYARGQGAEIDDALEVGERIGPLQVMGVPGKSPGEVVALFWQERKLLIVGDAMTGNPPGRCGLLPEKVMDDPLQLKQSIEDLLVFDFDTLLMGDGVSILSDAKDRLKELVASFRS